MIDNKEYYERNKIGENDEDRSTDDIEVLKLEHCVPKEINMILKNNLMR